EIDDAVGAEAGNHAARLRVERDQAIAGRDIEYALIVAAVAPIGETAARETARSRFAARAFVFAMRPEEFAGCSVECDDRATRTDGREDHAADHQGRALEIRFRARAEGVGLEAPRDLELAEI